MNSLSNLSRREREIMEIVFSLGGEATLSAIQEKMHEAPTRPALRSLLTILEGKGHLTHAKAGREFTYTPVLSKTKAGQSSLSRVVGTFFNGSFTKALASYLSDPLTKFTDDDIKELTSLVEAAKAKRAASDKKSH